MRKAHIATGAALVAAAVVGGVKAEQVATYKAPAPVVQVAPAPKPVTPAPTPAPVKATAPAAKPAATVTPNVPAGNKVINAAGGR